MYLCSVRNDGIAPFIRFCSYLYYQICFEWLKFTLFHCSIISFAMIAFGIDLPVIFLPSLTACVWLYLWKRRKKTFDTEFIFVLSIRYAQLASFNRSKTIVDSRVPRKTGCIELQLVSVTCEITKQRNRQNRTKSAVLNVAVYIFFHSANSILNKFPTPFASFTQLKNKWNISIQLFDTARNSHSNAIWIHRMERVGHFFLISLFTVALEKLAIETRFYFISMASLHLNSQALEQSYRAKQLR